MSKSFLNEILSSADSVRAKGCARFFKTNKGDYGEGDIFLGVSNPSIRNIVKEYYSILTLDEIDELIKNKYHEVRLACLLVLVSKFKKASIIEKENIYNLYLNNIKYINNWDLVDLSAPGIIGAYLFETKNTLPLYFLSKSDSLWAQRISVVSGIYFIRNNCYDLTLDLCRQFLEHKHDLMHKACGWMLREIGKRNEDVLCNFLDENAKNMPRTMLRYSIERFNEDKRKYYLSIKKVTPQ